MDQCPECGAIDNLCQTRFDELMALEFSDPAYFGTVHNLTVATFMLQHSSKLTKEGWIYERELLREFLVENKPPEFIRKQNKDLVDSGKRKFKSHLKMAKVSSTNPRGQRRFWMSARRMQKFIAKI